MNRFAILSILCLVTSVTPALHASPVNPLGDGYTITVGNTVLSDTNASFDNSTGVLTFNFNNSTQTLTFAEASASPLLDALSITRTCLAVNLTGCSGLTVSITDADVLNDTIEGHLLVGATLHAAASGSATTGVSTITFSNVAVAGIQTAVVGYDTAAPVAPVPVDAPVPEPGSITLVMSGVLGMATAARRRFLRG